MSAAKLGSEQCLPPRGKQPHERVCVANWRRSLCAAKRPRTPAGGEKRPPCQRGLAALAAWGIPTGFPPPPVTPADGQESLRLACARHLPLTREAFLAGFPPPPRHPFAAKSTPNSSLLTPPPPPPFPQTLQTLHALHKTCPLFAKPLPRLYRTMVETGAKPRYN